MDHKPSPSLGRIREKWHRIDSRLPSDTKKWTDSILEILVQRGFYLDSMLFYAMRIDNSRVDIFVYIYS